MTPGFAAPGTASATPTSQNPSNVGTVPVTTNGGKGNTPSGSAGATTMDEPVEVGGGGSTSGLAGAPGIGGSGGNVMVTDPVEPDGTELFFDDFDDGDDAGWLADMDDGNDVLGNWIVTEGNGGHVYRQATEYSDATFTYAGEPSWTDIDLQVDLAFLTTSDGDSATPVGEDGLIYIQVRRFPREGSDTDFNYVNVEFRSDGQVRIRRRLNGSSGDPIADWNNLGFSSMPGQFHHVGVRVEGSDISISYRGIVVGGGVIPTGIEMGQIGFGVVDATVDIDNVVVTAP